MCFSATASFIAGTTLSGIGVTTLGSAKSRAELPFALIPLLFGIQQLTEGVIWLTFQYDAPLLKQTMTYVYSGFSHVLWPIYVPFAIGFLEDVPWRKQTILAFQAIGILVGVYLLYFLTIESVAAQVVGMHIEYVSPHFYVIPVVMLYVAATCVSCFFSSHRFVVMFGVLALVAFVVAYLYQIHALVSIWCFFAAILSLLVFVHLRFRDLGGFPRRPVLEQEAPHGERVIPQVPGERRWRA